MHTGGSNLLQFNVRANLLEGSAAPLEACTGLVQLDISDNGFSGTLPAGPGWEAMASYRAGRNSFTVCRMFHSWPGLSIHHTFLLHPLLCSLTHSIPHLHTPTLANSLTRSLTHCIMIQGTFPIALAAAARMLEHLDVNGNALTGQFPNHITLLGALKNLDIANNKARERCSHAHPPPPPSPHSCLALNPPPPPCQNG